MSELLTQYEDEKIIKLVEKNSNIKTKISLPITWKKEDNIQINSLLEPYENLMSLSLLKSHSDKYFENLIKSFFICLYWAKISFYELYKLYIWKNALNKFRQDNWYKEGNYIKIWQWKEDNMIMKEIIKYKKNISFEFVYSSLDLKYKNLSTK